MYYDEGNANGEIPKQIPLFCCIIQIMEKVRNIAFIDAQNLNYSTTNNKPSWKVGLKQFRTYLLEKYKVDEAYYFLGCINDDYYKMVKFLVEEDRFCKILFPAKNRASSLYKQIPAKYRDYLDKPEIKKKIKKQLAIIKIVQPVLDVFSVDC